MYMKTLRCVCVPYVHAVVKFVLICKYETTLSSSEQAEYYPQVPVVILCTHICLFDTAPLHYSTSVISKTAVQSIIENGYRGERSLSALTAKRQKKTLSPLPS